MSVYGLTGGIGAGKSTVAGMIQEAGVPVVLADDVGRQVVSKGSEGLSAIVASFGAEVLDSTDGLDRRKLGGIVFNDPAKRSKLEGILHPLVLKHSQDLFLELEQAGNQGVVYESALLFEKKRHTEMKGVILVVASEEMRIARVLDRDGSELEDVRKRIQAQMVEEDKRKLSDYIIQNDGDMARLAVQVNDLIPRLV